jgi:cation transport ATPase
VGDGINDAPAMMVATVGMAIGQNSDVTAEAAGVVVLESSLRKVDEFMHISRRMRTIALQSAVGGMSLSIAGMFLAAFRLPKSSERRYQPGSNRCSSSSKCFAGGASSQGDLRSVGTNYQD